MSREEAIEELTNALEYMEWSGDKSCVLSKETIELAITALTEELSEDGTLTVHVSDGSKVSRVLVMGENIFGGLYYPDSAENKGDLISRQAVLDELEKWDWQELYLPIHFKENILDNLPTYSFPEVVHIKNEEELLKRLKECPLEVIAPTAVSFPEREKGKWIPVSKRLPDEEHEVYCQLSDGSNAVLYVQDNWGQMEWVDGMMGTGTYDVVAWREKPEPYKKGE